ncbi:unnamed protein product [Rotaria sordida]|uniref:Uncharacterized protein n=1 Tax=Rotaria sordida TaxID=392033 RepID=A0A814HKM5_9BILA|nr:unnamed protein product [Rotaria sordida]CAF1012391.1 unnamed protein product [Rotaria sordida]CAF1013024.1 unnamed protein product [Rotaria sordida]
MNRLLNLAIIYLYVTEILCEINNDDKTGTCRCYGEQHVNPFPASPGSSQNQYLCNDNSTKILIKNQFVQLFVTPNSQDSYSTVAYTLIFLPTAEYPNPCVISDSIAIPSNSSWACPNFTAANTIGSSTIQHHFHLTENILVTINNLGSHFDMMITQSFNLISQSEGACVNLPCGLEVTGATLRKKRQPTASDSTISQVCDGFINPAQKKCLGQVDKGFVQCLRVGCVHDTGEALDQRYAHGAATLLLQSSVEQYKTDKNFKGYLLKADAQAAEIIKQAQKGVNQMIQNSEPVCKENGKELNCLQPL